MVRRPGDDDLVGGHLAPGVLRRLHGLPGRRRRRRVRRRAARLHEVGQKPGRTTPTSGARPTRSPRTPRTCPTSTPRPTIFDTISYAKGNSVLRQLVTWLGDETFLAGVNTYLTRHRFGERHPRRLRRRARRGHRPRRARLGRGVAAHAPASTPSGSTRDGDGPGPAPRGRAAAPRPGHGVRRATGARSAACWSTWPTSRCRCRTSPAASWCPTPTARPSPGSCSTTARGRRCRPGCPGSRTTLTRAVLWTMLFDRVQTRDARPPRDFVDLVERHLPGRAQRHDRRRRC